MNVKETPANGPGTLTFDRPLIVLVEGADDRAFTARVIESMGPGDSWHVHHMDGNSTNWVGMIEVILNSDDFQDHGAAIGIVLDSDLNPAAAADKARGFFRAAGLDVPAAHGVVAGSDILTGFFLMPSATDNGALEEFILQGVDVGRRALAERYISDVEAAHTKPRKLTKAVLQAYFAGQYEHVKSIPVAVQKKAVVDVSSPTYASFAAFLRALATKI